jgi:hypothetical protein
VNCACRTVVTLTVQPVDVLGAVAVPVVESPLGTICCRFEARQPIDRRNNLLNGRSHTGKPASNEAILGLLFLARSFNPRESPS